MPVTPRTAVLLVLLVSAVPAFAAERSAVVGQEAYACTSWAAWREYGQASLMPKGARMSKTCPIRIPAGTKVTIVDEDAGEGASQIRYKGAAWFVDSQRLK